MAGDWIKFDVTTPNKPEIDIISNELNIDADAVVGKLLRIWVWANQQSLDGNAISVTHTFLDRLVFCNGFALAMRKAGWLEGRNGLLSFPHFDRHNGQSAKHRAMTNRRVAKSRSNMKRKCNENVTVRPLQKALPEKRREEYKKDITKVISKKNNSPPAKTQRRAKPDSVAEVIAYVHTLGLPDSDGEYLYEHWQSNGYTRNNKPIKDWKAACRSWNAAGYFPTQKHRKETKHEQTDYSEGFTFKR